MKKTIFSLAVATMLLASCTTSKQATTNEQRYYISWIAFCANRGYNINDNTNLTINEYIDTWCGSVEEEQAFINAGVEPY